tara:strand:+ start:191 stop:409 length:219 start_codon:yes stop_codon:yes gene_type:complete
MAVMVDKRYTRIVDMHGFGRVTRRTKDIARAIVMEPEMSYGDLAERFGVSRQRVGQIARRLDVSRGYIGGTG